MNKFSKLISLLAAISISATAAVGAFAAETDATDVATATETATVDPSASPEATEVAPEASVDPSASPEATEVAPEATVDPSASPEATEVAPEATATVKPLENPFPDAQNDWYSDSVAYAYTEGLIDGYDDGTFKPQGNVTRAELTQILYKIDAKEKNVEIEKAADGEEWFAPAQKWAEANKVTVHDTYAGNEALTREEVITMMYNAYAASHEVEDASEVKLDEFVDYTEVSEYALEATKWMFENELVEGDDNMKLNPKANVTRAETATLLERYLTKLTFAWNAPATEAPSEDATEEPSEDATEEPSEDATEAPSEEATEEPSEEPTETPEPTAEEDEIVEE